MPAMSMSKRFVFAHAPLSRALLTSVITIASAAPVAAQINATLSPPATCTKAANDWRTAQMAQPLAAYRAAGAPLEVPLEAQNHKNLSAMLHTWSEQSHRSFRKGTPVPGDVVFFRDTIVDQGLKNHVTHVALVESVDDDGTVRLLHFMGGKIRRDRMNLARPTDPSANGWLRKKRHAKDPALAGELFVAYARFE